jgi:hypothetical protein
MTTQIMSLKLPKSTEDMDYRQLRGEVGPANYTADILRIQKMAVDGDIEIEEDEEEEEAKRRLLVGRVYL